MFVHWHPVNWSVDAEIVLLHVEFELCCVALGWNQLVRWKQQGVTLLFYYFFHFVQGGHPFVLESQTSYLSPYWHLLQMLSQHPLYYATIQD